MAQRVRKAVLPVAGLGTRFLPATKAVPKEMLTVVDRPVVQHGFQTFESSPGGGIPVWTDLFWFRVLITLYPSNDFWGRSKFFAFSPVRMGYEFSQ